MLLSGHKREEELKGMALSSRISDKSHLHKKAKLLKHCFNTAVVDRKEKSVH